MADLIRALAPTSPEVSIFGSMVGAVATRQAVPNAAIQPPRIYTLLQSGGGVVFRKEAAVELQQAGFTVSTFDPDERELAFLTALDPEFSNAKQLWSVFCDRFVYEVEGKRRCADPKGVERIPTEEAMTTEMVTSADLSAPLQHVPPGSIRGYRVYAPSSDVGLPGAGMVMQALGTVRLMDQIRFRIDALVERQKNARIPMTPAVEGYIAAAAATLAKYSQPVQEFRKGYAALRGKMIEAKIPGADTLPEDPFSRFGEPVTLSASAIAAIALIAVIAVSAAVAVVVLSQAWTEVSAASAELDLAEAKQREVLIKCISDGTLPSDVRRGCERSMRELTKQTQERTERGQDNNPFAGLEDILKWGVGLAAIGFTAIYFGPVIRQSAEAAAGQIQSFSQRRAQRQ